MAADRRDLAPGAFLVEERPGSAPVVFLRGELDLSSVAGFREQLTAVSEAHSSLVVDMADASFIDGSVLGALAAATTRFPDGVVVQGATGLVARIFRLGDMEHLLAD